MLEIIRTFAGEMHPNKLSSSHGEGDGLGAFSFSFNAHNMFLSRLHFTLIKTDKSSISSWNNLNAALRWSCSSLSLFKC